MKVLVLTTWDNPKDDEGLRNYYKYLDKHRPQMTERRKKYNVKNSAWSDGTGKMYNIDEFEGYDAYAKFWDDEESHKRLIHFLRLVNNAEIKVLRETIAAPP
jgi:hypothetical protein